MEGDRAVGLQREVPSPFVHEVVMLRAQRQQIFQVGEAESFPRDDVVDLTVVERNVAVRMGAGAVHGTQRSALGAVGDALFAPDGERFAVGAQHDRDDGRLAAQPADRVDRQRDAVRGLADRRGVETIGERRQVDVDAHLWHPAFTVARRSGTDDFDEGDHGELSPGRPRRCRRVA